MASERQADDQNSPWWGEHIHRYLEAVKTIGNGNRILDIACGTGFGSAFLSQQNNEVIGGDLSSEAIDFCKQKYKNAPHLEFKIIDGTAIPYADQFFDVVISFETIEHTTEYRKMLEEFRRVVKKDGLIIISTPNFPVNSPKGVIDNPYHTQEWTYTELQALLSSVYSKADISGQQYTRYAHAPGARYKLGRIVEGILYSRGIRKLPLPLQDRLMQLLIGKKMYPSDQDYTMQTDKREIEKCKTFFAVCKP